MKKIISTFIFLVIIINIIPKANVSAARIVIDKSFSNINDETLAEMVNNGEIPQNVTELYLTANKISDLSSLTKLNNLNYLCLGDNQIIDITPLSSLTNLKSLSLPYNQITDLTPLSNLTNLGGSYGVLELEGNQITDISPLSNLTKLEWLGLENNQITDLTPLYSLRNLTFFTLWDNPVTDKQITELYEVLEKANFIGRILAGEPKLEDAVTVIMHVAKLPTFLDDNAYAFYVACITGGEEPKLEDAVQIILCIAKLPNKLNS